MGRFFAAMGHRNILMISDNDLAVDHHRWLGLKRGLEDAGIFMEEKRHVIVSNLYEERLVQLRQHKKLFRQQTALFFSSDYYAMEACSVLRHMGFRIPEDISVAGFDDLFSSRMVTPALTTIRQNIDQKAKMAVDGLFGLMNGTQDGTESRKALLPVELIERESVKRLG